MSLEFSTMLDDNAKTKAQLLAELSQLRKRVESNHSRALFDNAPLPYQSLDEEGRIIDVNKAWLELLGYSKEKVIGRFIGELLTPESIELLKERFCVFLAQGEVRHADFTMIKRDGSRVMITVNGRIGYDEAGNFKQTHCILHDVTHARRSENNLALSEQRFRGLFESSIDGLIYLDTFGSILNVNPSFCLMTGYTPEDLLGKNILDITAPESRDRSVSLRKKSLQGDSSHEYEDLYIHKDGHLVPAAVRIWLNTDDNGNSIGSWGVIRDLTSQKESEENIAQSENMYRLLAENAEDVIWTVDNNLKYNYISPSIFRLRGFTPEEIMLDSFEKSMTEESYRRVIMAHQKAMENEARGEKNASVRIEVELFHKNGSTVWAEIIARTLYDTEGVRIGFVGMTRDISDRKKIESQLQASETSMKVLLNATSDAVGLFSTDGSILTMNKSMAEAMSSTLEAKPGKHITECFPGQLGLGRLAKFEQVAETKLPTSLRDVRAGRIIDSAFFPVLTESGEVSAIAVYAKDITESLLAEEAQKQSAAQYRRIVETANEGIMGLDASHRITYANQITADFLGYPLQDLLGTSIYSILLPEDIEDHNLCMKRRIEGKRERYERRFVRKNGDICWGLVSATPMLAEDGNHLGSFAMIADITETKESEKTIRESEERYRRIVQTANEGVLHVGPEGSIVFANDRFCSMLGYSIDELRTLHATDLVSPEERSALLDHLVLREQGISESYELRALRKDGCEIWVQLSASPIFDDNGVYQGTLSMIMDITKRRSAEAALKLTQFSVDNASIDIYWLNNEGRIVYTNDHACNSLGYTHDEMLSLTVSDLNPTFLPEEWADYWIERRSNTKRQFESIHQRKDGTEFPVGITSHYWKYDGQEYLFIYSYDLSERQQAEEKLRRNQELLNEVQRISLTGGWEVDMVTGETNWTDGQFQLHGLEPSTVPADIRLFFESYVHPADRALLAEGWQTVITEHVPVELEYRSRKADETEAVFVGVAIPDLDENGNIRRVFGSTRDVTAEKQAAEELKQAHERLLTLLDGIDADIYVSDLDTNEILFMNAHMREHFGAPDKDIPCHEMFRGEKEPCSFCPKPHLLDEFGRPIPTVIDERYNPLTHRWYLNHDRAIEWLEGKRVHMHMAADITELKSMAEDLKLAMSEAQAASMAKNEFLANMSHEIRTPLNGLLGMLQLLQLTNLVAEQRDYLDTAVDSGRNLLQILNDILDLSKIESGKLELDEYDFELGDVLDSVIAVFRSQAKSRGLDMSWKIDESLGVHFSGDKGRLRQVLFNLVGNAAKFTETGFVTVEAYPLQHTLKNDKILLYFSVKDSGIGIPEDKVNQVFDPFTQVDGSFTRKYQGTGLGLGIVRRLVNLMGGTIAIMSKEGEGTSIIFTIAVTPQKTVKKAAAIVQKKPGSKGMSILVAEDERVNRTVAQKLLTKLGYNPLCVESGESALTVLQSQTFDCILMDIQMPGIDGLETTRAIRKQLRLNIPIIALTAHAMKGDKQRFMDAGMNGYVAKPFNISELQTEIERVMTDC